MKRMSFIVFYTYNKEIGYGNYVPIEEYECLELNFEIEVTASEVYGSIVREIGNRRYGTINIKSVCKVNEYQINQDCSKFV